MKKLISSVLAMAALFCATSVHAENITPAQAGDAAAYFMGQYMGIGKLTAENLTLVYQIDNLEMNIPAAYFFNVGDCGWIIIGGSTIIDPIIGYSDHGTLVPENLPANMKWWVEGYASLVMGAQAYDAKHEVEDCVEWQEISSRKADISTKGDVILTMVTWGQGDNTHPYNYYCPEVDGVKSVTGCVATAFSQMCYYYRYPKNPQGSVTYVWNRKHLKLKFDTISYDYSKMANAITTSSSAEKIREVARLCMNAGYAVQMDYSPDGSGAYQQNYVPAFANYYKYKYPTVVSRNGNENSTDNNFMTKLRNELMAKNIVFMAGSSHIGTGADAGGHAWLVTGYKTDNEKRVYMNWGWDGSSDGWFNLATNSENGMYAGGYSFTDNQRLLIGLTPPDDSNRFLVNIVETDNSLLGTAYPNPATLSVFLPYRTNNAADMNVYSMDGKLVATRRVQAGEGEIELRVDAMPAGIYIYRLNSQVGKFVVR